MMKVSPLRDAISQSPRASPKGGIAHRSASTGRRHRNAENFPPNVTPTSGNLPPRPPSSTGKICKRLKFDPVAAAAQPEGTPSDSGAGVTQVVIRVRPKEQEAVSIVTKISGDSLVVNDQQYTFDAVASEESSQNDMFQIVGLPIVENCLAGFNSSIFAYGQTGSGKTYTMWGADAPSEDRGLTPRVFESLFSRIKEEESKNSDKQLYFQCRCSFLEIYNEQIADLLEPRHRNLQIREDVKCGVYVSNLTEEYVSDMSDVSRLLVKGLANRRVGATSMNAESSRSHTVFTCVLECRFKRLSDGMSSVRRSRINLVDLAGSERQKQSGAAGERLKEAGNINRSLSQLGNVINILAEVTQTGKQRHIPYRDSRLTFLLQESLGGNAKLAMICAISPADSCKSETASTLRFAQRAKAIQNKAVVNEETTNDTTLLREQVRQLKDELKRMRSKESQRTGVDGAYSSGWNARRSYNLLRLSLAAIPKTPAPVPEDSDSDEDMEIDDDNPPEVPQAPSKLPESEIKEEGPQGAEIQNFEVREGHTEMEGVGDSRPDKLPAFSPDELQEVEELKRALEMAMTGHARLLEQYAELQDKHIALVAKQRKIREGVSDVRQMGLKAGMSSSQVKWLESQAAQIVALNLEREQERETAREEMEFLQSQLQDTREAIQNAGELLARLKEAEEDAIIARDAAALAEQDAERLYREMEKMRRRHATEVATLQQRLLEWRLRRSAACPMCVVAERVKFEFPEVDPDKAQADMEVEEDAAALEQPEEPLPSENEEELYDDLYDGSEDRCNL